MGPCSIKPGHPHLRPRAASRRGELNSKPKLHPPRRDLGSPETGDQSRGPLSPALAIRGRTGPVESTLSVIESVLPERPSSPQPVRTASIVSTSFIRRNVWSTYLPGSRSERDHLRARSGSGDLYLTVEPAFLDARTSPFPSPPDVLLLERRRVRHMARRHYKRLHPLPPSLRTRRPRPLPRPGLLV